MADAIKGQRVLELGAGTGVLGITAALLGAHVTMTDVADVLPLLRSNALENRPAALQAGGSVTVALCDWGLPETLWRDLPSSEQKDPARLEADVDDRESDAQLSPDIPLMDPAPECIRAAERTKNCAREGRRTAQPFGVILGGDLVYSAPQVPLLLEVLREVLRGSPAAEVLLGHKSRSDDVDRALFEGLDALGLCVRPVGASRAEAAVKVYATKGLAGHEHRGEACAGESCAWCG